VGRILRSSNVIVALSVIILLVVCFIIVDSYHFYVGTDGKGRALFGMLEYLNYGWKYWLLIPSFICIGVLFSRRRLVGGVKFRLGIVLNIVSIGCIVSPVWRLFQYFVSSR
jgi:hypothetical protein